MTQPASAHVLILVENLSVPFDRRVWQESRALSDAGFRVTVICPTGLNRDRALEEIIDGVDREPAGIASFFQNSFLPPAAE